MCMYKEAFIDGCKESGKRIVTTGDWVTVSHN